MGNRETAVGGDALDIIVLVKIVLSNWRTLLFFGVLSFACAFLYLSLAKVQYRATTDAALREAGSEVLDVIGACGTLASLQTRDRGFLNSPRINPQICSNFFRQDWGATAYIDPIVSQLNWQGTPNEELLRQTFNAEYLPTRNVVVFSARVYGRENAVAAISAARTVLDRFQEDTARQVKSVYDEVMFGIDAGISDTEALLAQLENLSESGEWGTSFEEFLLERFTVEESQRLRELRHQEYRLEQSFGDAFLQSPSNLEVSDVHSERVHPKSKRVWTFAAIAGFFIGILAISFNAMTIQAKNRIGTGPDEEQNNHEEISE